MRPKLAAHRLETRIEQGRRLRAMYRSLGWSRADCGKFLHVTERCLRNWEAGRNAIPYAAYRLLRIHCGMRLPGAAWRGWSLSRGKLCTPEGHELDPRDAAWWSLLVRRAQTGSEALRQLHAIKSGQRPGAATGADASGFAAAPATGAATGRQPAQPAGGGEAIAAGLVPYKTSATFSASKTIAANQIKVSVLHKEE